MCPSCSSLVVVGRDRSVSMYRGLLLIIAGAAVAAAGESPHANLVREFLKSPEASRYSNNLLEDALLDVPGLIEKYGYPVEVHDVVTEDGYIIQMQRIPHGRDRNNVPDANKTPVLLMHGLLSSAADYVIMGPGISLGYMLAEEGYDVWMGNARGTFYSRRHVTLDPDARNSYWNFSWDEIGRIDLPSMIDYILEKTGKSRLHYVGHSQGTTVFWVMGSLRPEYNDKIISMQALAPVAYLEFNQNRLFILLAPHANRIETIANLVGVREFLPKNELTSQLGGQFCADGSPIQSTCSNFLFLIAGRSEDQHNATMFPVKLGHAPGGASLRQIVHYAQFIQQPYFRRYDHGTLGNFREYRSFTPPSYDLRRVTAPAFLHYSDYDVFAHVNDVRRLHNELGNSKGMVRVPLSTFSHVDFIWGIDVVPLLYNTVLASMRSME